MNKSLLLIVFALTLGIQGFEIFAQGTSIRELKPMSKKSGDPIICYSTDVNMHTYVPLRESLELMSRARTEETQGAVFDVTYFGFTIDQRDAFQFAVDIWAGLLKSEVPIRIEVRMSDTMAEGTLASTGWGGLNANFNNAQQLDTWYLVALAEKIAGEELNDQDDPDITMTFNAQRNFYTGIDGQTPANAFDLVSIALHEIAHGLGFFTHTFVSENGNGQIATVSDLPTVYMRNIENGSNENIYDKYEESNPSMGLGAELTGDDLFFKSFSFSGTNRPRLYAPADWNGGSSISHLNESTYPTGSSNSLMTPQLNFAEAVHDPGISLEMLEDMGWISMNIVYNALLDTEDSSKPRAVTATIAGDNAVANDGVNLFYTFSDWGAGISVPMSATANPDEYSTEIPASDADAIVSYYVSVADASGKTFTSPGEAPSFYNQYVVAADTIDPVLFHQPLNFVFVDDPIARINATVGDNLGTDPLMMTYRINNEVMQTIEVPISKLDTDGYYFAEHYLELDLGAFNIQKGDIVEYKLSVTDSSSNANKAIHPSEDIGFNKIQIDALNPAVEFYATDFNSSLENFIGDGFEIGSVPGFSSGILHSDHPYRVTPGMSAEDTLSLFQLLKSPIIISAQDPSIRFDEVVLVEPGEPGKAFGDDEFWDYVVVEGSRDFGVTWQLFSNGYDSKANADWLNHYNSDLVVKTFTSSLGSSTYQDSEADGDESLFKQRSVDMLENGNFMAGEEVLIRFKLYADQLSAGWGWAVDNLKIQIDDKKPEIAHIATDFLLLGATELKILSKVTDNVSLNSVTYEIVVNGNTEVVGIDVENDLYEHTVNLNPVTESSVIKYRIIAVDNADSPNTAYLPKTGFFEIPIAVLGEAKTFYDNDFNTDSNDFYGANFSISNVNGFGNPAIHSLHPYSNSPSGISSMSYLLKYPIKTNKDHAWMSFDEVVLVNSEGDGVQVSVSNNNGATWFPVIDRYSSIDDQDWTLTFNQKDLNGNSIGQGTSQLYRKRLVDLLAPSSINEGEEVLVRFDFKVNDQFNGWGWAIDNIEIQGVTTNLEDLRDSRIGLYPNPVENGKFVLEGTVNGRTAAISITDMMGKVILIDQIETRSGSFMKDYNLNEVKPGIYLVSVKSADRIETTRLILR